MYILDVSDPARIVKLDSIPFPPGDFSITGNGDTMLAAASSAGLGLFDISDKRSPRLISQYITPDYAIRCVLRDGYAFAACFTAGVRIIDYHNPTQPVEIGSYPLPYTTYDVKIVQDTFAYVSNWVGGFKVLNVSNLRAPFEVFSYQHPRFWPADPIAIRNSIAVIGYPVVGGGEFQVWDIADPVNPVQLSAVGVPCSRLEFLNDTLIMGSYGSSVVIFNLKDPRAPREVTRFPLRLSRVRGNRCYAFTREGDTLVVLDISDPANPVRLGGTFIEYHTYTEGVSVQGDYVYTATRGQGMKVYDVSDRRNPRFVAQFGDGIRVGTVVVRDTLAYLGCSGTPGLRIVNIRNPLIPVEVVAVDSVWDINAILLQDTIAFLAGECCWILDIKDLTAPRILARIERGPSRQAFWGCAVVDNFLLTTESYGGMRVFDISDLANPVPVAHCDTIEAVHGIKVKFPYVFLTGSYGLLVFDISDPKEPKWVTHCQTDDYAWDIKLDGHYAYVAAGDYGIRVYDVSEPELPEEVGYYITPSWAGRLYCADGLIYVADWSGWCILEHYGRGVKEERGTLSSAWVLRVFYEPAGQTLRIKLSGRNEPIKTVEVFNSTGTRVGFAGRKSIMGAEAVVSPRPFASGVYFIKVITTNRNLYTAKFTVVK